MRRTRALLDQLAARVRPEHRPAVLEEIAALDEALEHASTDPRWRAFAGLADAQGIGGPSTR
jgi:hypothetical protein